MTLTDSDITRIKAYHEVGLTQSSIRAKAGHSRVTIGRVVAGKLDRIGARKVSRIVEKRRMLLAKLVRMRKRVGNRVLVRYPSAGSLVAPLKRAGFNASRTTVYRDLLVTHENRTRPKRPFDGENSFRMRRELKKRYKMTCGKRFVFSDEHFVTTNDHTCKTQWVAKGERSELVPRVHKSRYNIPSVMIWGAIGFNYKSPLVFIKKTEDEDGKKLGMNSKRYVSSCLAKMLNGPNAIPRGRIFMQDGARCHTAKATLAYLARKGQVVLEGWPPYSPDLNPIENLWRYIDVKIAERAPATLAELQRVTLEVWDAIPMSVINNYVLSFKGRFATHIQ